MHPLTLIFCSILISLSTLAKKIPDPQASIITPNTTTNTTINTATNTTTTTQATRLKYLIDCKISLNNEYEQYGNIFMTCRNEKVLFDYYLRILGDFFVVEIDGKRQLREALSFPFVNASVLVIGIRSSVSAFVTNSISIAIQQNQITRCLPQFTFFISGPSLIYFSLTPSQNATLDTVSSISDTIMSGTQKIFTILKSCAVSYFLINIISFWNLSLMYNVLNISTVPAFSKYFLEKLTLLFFNLNSMSEWVRKNVPGFGDGFDFVEVGEGESRELMEDERGGFSWFGVFGLSAWFLRNNIEAIFVILLLFVKIGVILGVRRLPFLARKIKRKIPKGLQIVEIFLFQLIGLQTFMIISSGTAILAEGYLGLNEKINAVLQFFPAWLGFMLLALYLIVTVQLSQKKQSKKLAQKNKETHSSQQTANQSQTFSIPQTSRRILITELNNTLEFIPIILIPFLILFDNPSSFLVITSLVVGSRIFWYFRYFKKFCMELDEKIFTGLNILCWAVLQVSYIVMLVLEKIMNDGDGISGDNKTSAYFCVKICGFLSIFAVLGGGLFQLLRFLVKVAKFVIKGIKKLLQKRKTKIQPERPTQKQKVSQEQKLPRSKSNHNRIKPTMIVTSKQLNFITSTMKQNECSLRSKKLRTNTNMNNPSSNHNMSSKKIPEKSMIKSSNKIPLRLKIKTIMEGKRSPFQ